MIICTKCKTEYDDNYNENGCVRCGAFAIDLMEIKPTNKPGRPPLNKPAVSVKIYSDTMKILCDIKAQIGKPIIQIIDELSKRAGKCKVTWTVGIDEFGGRQGWCECGHSVFNNNIYCSHCGKVITHYVQSPYEAARG